MKRRLIFGVLILLLCEIRAFCATLPRVTGQWPGIPAGGVQDLKILGNTLFANIYRNIAVIDITDSSRPRRVGTIRMPDYFEVKTAGRYLLERNSVSFRLLDVTERASPVEVARVDGTFAYVPTETWPYMYMAKTNLMIYDFTNPQKPVVTDSRIAGPLGMFRVSGDRMVARDFGAANLTLRFFDISNRAKPVRGASYWSDGFLLMRGNYAYFFTSKGTVKTVDISDVTNPKNIGEETYGSYGMPMDVAAVGDYVLVSFSNRFEILDLKDPTQPKSVRSVPSTGYISHAQKGNDLYFVDYNGITVFDVTNPMAPIVKAEILTQPYYGNVGAIGDKVILHNWSGPAQLIDVTNPAHPIAFEQFLASYWSELVGNKLFLGDTKDSIHLYDASDLQHPQELSRLSLNDLGISSASDGDRLFVTCSNTIKVVNFSDRNAMVVENSISLPGTWNSGMARTGTRLAITMTDYMQSYLSILDISDPAHPAIVSTVTNSARFGKVAANGNAVYVCSPEELLMFEIGATGNLIERGGLAASAGDVAVSGQKLAVFSGELRIYDVSAPFAPILLGGLTDMPNESGHVIILGDYAYVAAANSGLITVQLAGEPPAQPTLEIIDEGEMHRIRWTADFSNSFLVHGPTLRGPWSFQPTFNDTKMFNEATAPNEADMQFYELLK